jgi:hypothetical protein
MRVASSEFGPQRFASVTPGAAMFAAYTSGPVISVPSNGTVIEAPAKACPSPSVAVAS